MSKITVTIKTDGAAFRHDDMYGNDDLNREEVRRVLSEVADKIEAGHYSGGVLDLNGNTAATYVRTED